MLHHHQLVIHGFIHPKCPDYIFSTIAAENQGLGQNPDMKESLEGNISNACIG